MMCGVVWCGVVCKKCEGVLEGSVDEMTMDVTGASSVLGLEVVDGG